MSGRPTAPTRAPSPGILVPGVLLFSLVLLRAPTLAGASPSLTLYALSLLPFCLAIGSLLLLHRPRWFVSGGVLIVLAYVGLLVISILRGAYFGVVSQNAAALQSVQFTLVVALGMCAFLRAEHPEHRASYLRALCWSPVVFVAVNIVLYFAGILPVGQFDAESRLPASMLQILGIGASRVQFPLSSGLNGIGPTAAAALVICFVFIARNRHRKLAIAGVLASLFVILTIDSRGALLFAVLSLCVLRVWARGRGWVAILLPVLSVALVLILPNLAETEAGNQLERGGIESLSTGTGPTVVWGVVLDVFAHPKVDHVFGYGQLGQITSGASVNYAYMFRGEIDPLARTAHSLLLQSLLDMGWLGLLCLLGLAFVVLQRLEQFSADPYYMALLAAALSLLLVGIVQTAPTPTQPDSFAFWLLTACAAMRARSLSPASAQSPRT